MTRTIFDPIEVIRSFTHAFKNGMKHIDIIHLAIGTNEIRLANTSAIKNSPDS